MKLNPQDDSETSSGTMQLADIRGEKLEHEDRGDGEPVLLIHGALIAGSFLPLMDEPSLANYRLIRYHRRGYAGSTGAEGPPSTYIEQAAADATALLQHLRVERAHIVGHSNGGLVALQLMLDEPDLVHSVVLLEPALVMTPGGREHAKNLIPVVKRYREGNVDGAVDGFMQEVAGPEWRREITHTVPGGPDQAVQDAATFFELEFPAVGRWEFDEEKAKKIEQPILYVRGSESLSFIQEGRDLVHTWFSQAEDHLVQGVNHNLQMQDPLSVAEGIASFLKRHPIKKSSNQ